MSVAQMMGARLLMSVFLTQLAMTTPLVMAQSVFPPPPPPPPAPPFSPRLDLESVSPPKDFFSLWRVIVGVAVAVVCVKILVILAVFGIVSDTTDNELVLKISSWKRGCRRQSRVLHGDCQEHVEDFDAQVATVSMDEAPQQDVAPQRDEAYNMDFRRYSYAEVKAISSNWKFKPGESGFGPVYYGEISSDASPDADPQRVALKRLSATSQQGKNEFLIEVRLLSRIHFWYLVPLVGFCDEANNQLLIYEYVQEGSLADWLHGAKRDHPDFSWDNRLLIALHAPLERALCQRLEYLHEGARPYIVHRDVKSSNILISSDWEGRVANFGLSKTNSISDGDRQRTHMTTLVKGTPGYLDPEYMRTGQLTKKCDVYSCGIVLLELVTGRFPTDWPRGDPQFPSIKRYVQSHNPHNLATIADPSLKGNYDVCSMQKIVQVALRSVARQGIDRPTMSEVVVEIRSAMDLGGDRGQTRSRPGIRSSLESTASSSATNVPSFVPLLK